MNRVTNPATIARLRRQYRVAQAAHALGEIVERQAEAERLDRLQATLDRYAVAQGWGVWDGEEYRR